MDLPESAGFRRQGVSDRDSSISSIQSVFSFVGNEKAVSYHGTSRRISGKHSMNSLLHDLFQDLILPNLLAWFAAFEVIVLTSAGVWIWLSDGTRDEDLPELTTSPDPFETAFLRRGARGVTRLYVVSLIERGFLVCTAAGGPFAMVSRAKLLARNPAAPDIALLNPIERTVWNWLTRPKPSAHLFHRHHGLLKEVTPRCEVYTKPLVERRLLEPSARRLTRTWLFRALCASIVGLGLTVTVIEAMSNPAEAPGPLVLMALGLVATRITCRHRRLSDLGHRYLEQLQMDYGDWNDVPPMDDMPQSRSTPSSLRINSGAMESRRMLQLALSSGFDPCFASIHEGSDGICCEPAWNDHI